MCLVGSSVLGWDEMAGCGLMICKWMMCGVRLHSFLQPVGRTLRTTWWHTLNREHRGMGVRVVAGRKCSSRGSRVREGQGAGAMEVGDRVHMGRHPSHRRILLLRGPVRMGWVGRERGRGRRLGRTDRRVRASFRWLGVQRWQVRGLAQCRAGVEECLCTEGRSTT